jgi:hypothetical protein
MHPIGAVTVIAFELKVLADKKLKQSDLIVHTSPMIGLSRPCGETRATERAKDL